MEHLSSGMEQQQNQQQVQWRRDKVQELCSKGYNQREISHILQVGLATITMMSWIELCTIKTYDKVLVSMLPSRLM